MKRIQSVLLLALLLFWFNPSHAAKKPNVKKLAKAITSAYDALHPTGMAVAVVKDGEIVYKEAFGYANAETKEALETDHLFNIASCSKAFTAAALSILVHSGQVKWDDPVQKYIPEFKLADPYISEHLQVYELLCHRSGLGTFFGDLLWYGTSYSDEEILKRMEFLPISHEFRGRFGYQNNLFMIAGLIIERVTGKTWSQFINQQLFQPLKMEQTRPSNDELEEGQKIARGHFKGEMLDVYDFNGTKPAASIYSNVEELANWMKMLLNGGSFNGTQVLSQEQLQAISTPRTLQRVNEAEMASGTHFKSYGLGWSMYDLGGKKVMEHDGGMPGYISKVCIVPEEKLGVVVLNNGFDFFSHDVVRSIVLDEYLGLEKKDWAGMAVKDKAGYLEWKENNAKKRLASRELNTSPSQPHVAYCGLFEDKMYGQAEVRLEEGDLFIKLLPTAKFFHSKMEHWENDSFKVEFDDPFLPYGIINFELDGDGTVTGFKIDLPNGDFHFFNLDFKSLE